MCEACDDTGWVCENCGMRWDLAEGGTCCGAGKSCICNPNGSVDWQVVYAATELQTVKERKH